MSGTSTLGILTPGAFTFGTLNFGIVIPNFLFVSFSESDDELELLELRLIFFCTLVGSLFVENGTFVPLVTDGPEIDGTLILELCFPMLTLGFS